jgi:hypothetical protein
MPKMRSHVLSEDPVSRYPHNLAGLREMLAKFQSVLPASLDWTTIGIPVLEVDTFKSVDAQNIHSVTAEPQKGDSQASDSHAIKDPQTADSETETSQAAVCNTRYTRLFSALLFPLEEIKIPRQQLLMILFQTASCLFVLCSLAQSSWKRVYKNVLHPGKTYPR